tara:strand:- start:7431 stop:7685 length:255 start_codon:yes stop_codon:yes gene_type:complete
MKYDYKMLEATNKDEAIVSILDAVKHNAVWLNKCQSHYARTLINHVGNNVKEQYLNQLNKDDVIDLFVELKTEYYNFKDNTRWS